MSRTAATAAGRTGRAWREVSARVYRDETHCWVCGLWVDPSLHPKDRMARSADHLVQLQHGGAPTDRTNLRLAHLGCNTARSNALRALPVHRCACSTGLPCAVLNPIAKRGFISVGIHDL